MRAYDHERMHRRAKWHDYRSRCYYMITINALPAAPVLSHLKLTPSGTVITELTEYGKAIDHFLFMIDSFHPSLSVRKKVVMPDHIHFLLIVKEETERPVFVYIDRFIKRVEEAVGKPLLCGGFHDRIIHGRNQLTRVISYIDDNPRKLYVKRLYPDMFRVGHRIEVGGFAFEVMGNIFLLEDLEIEPVVFSSHYTDEELLECRHRWYRSIIQGGVIISPFVHPLERKVLDFALSVGGKAICLRSDPFMPREKPGSAMFDACSEGHLLILAPVGDDTFSGRSYRDICLLLNRCSTGIASRDFGVS